MSRARRARAEAAAREPAVLGADRLARWRSFTHRGTTITFAMSGIVVAAENPKELVAQTKRVIVEQTKDSTAN